MTQPADVIENDATGPASERIGNVSRDGQPGCSSNCNRNIMAGLAPGGFDSLVLIQMDLIRWV
jgi:hypothetical protein